MGSAFVKERHKGFILAGRDNLFVKIVTLTNSKCVRIDQFITSGWLHIANPGKNKLFAIGRLENQIATASLLQQSVKELQAS